MTNYDAKDVALELYEALRPHLGGDRLLKYPEAADVLSCSVNTVRNLVETGELVPTWVTPRSPRISRDQLNRFVRASTGRPER